MTFSRFISFSIIIFSTVGLSVREFTLNEDGTIHKSSSAEGGQEAPSSKNKQGRGTSTPREVDNSENSSNFKGVCARTVLKKTQDKILEGIKLAQRNRELQIGLSNNSKDPKWALTEILSQCAGLGRALGASQIASKAIADDFLAENIVNRTLNLHELSSALYQSCFEAELAASHGAESVDFDIRAKQKLIRSLADNLENLVKSDRTMLDNKPISEAPPKRGYRVVRLDESGKEIDDGPASEKKEDTCREDTLSAIEEEVSRTLQTAKINLLSTSTTSPAAKIFILCADLTRAMGAVSLAVVANGDPKLAERTHKIASLADKESEIQDVCFSNRLEAVHPGSQKKDPIKQVEKLTEITKKLLEIFPPKSRV